jgi:hypothetical protein
MGQFAMGWILGRKWRRAYNLTEVAMLVPVIVGLAILVVVGAWTRFLYRQYVARPFSMACSATAAGVWFSGAGLAGYTLSKHDRFVAHTSWVDHVIWPQVWLGALAACFAVFFWRRALSGRGQG